MAGLSDGIIESSVRTRIKHNNQLFSDDGIYGDSHRALAEKLAPKFSRKDREQNILRLKQICVFNCERAKIWLSDQRCGRLDINAARDAYHREVIADIVIAIDALKTLQKLDLRQPYYLRQAIAAGLLKQMPEKLGFEAIFPDANLPAGGISIDISSEVREAVEPQFLMQACLWKFDIVLETAIQYLSRWYGLFDHPVHALGNLRFTPGLCNQSRSGISRDRDQNLGIATLCLTGTLSCWFRRVTAGQFPGIFYDGDVYPKDIGNPCWELVANYVEAALPSSDSVTSQSVKQRWHVISKGREVRICRWPEKGERQPQLHKRYE